MHKQIVELEEYKEMLNSALYSSINAKDSERCNLQGYFKMNALQDRFFPNFEVRFTRILALIFKVFKKIKEISIISTYCQNISYVATKS